MAHLAIKGHPTRGKEVIEILEMLGGVNTYKINHTEKNLLYCLREGDNVIIATYPNTSITNIFTIERFLEKFPYKVGDKVSSKYLKNYEVSKMEWESANNRVIYKLQGMGWYSADELQPYKEETMEEKRTLVQIDLTSELCIANEVEVILGDYEFVLKDGKTYFVKKKPKYPNTYEECCKMLGYSGNYNMILTTDVDNKLFNALYRLKVCRDAYWKIAGEQMGLGKPWEYDMSKDEFSYAISYQYGDIQKSEVRYKNHFLSFPTKKMRNAFYENFKDSIEECKEFL